MSQHKSINPYTGQTVKTHEYFSDEQIAEKLELASRTFKEWKLKSFQERAQSFIKLAQLMRERQQALAELMTVEMGKPITQARLEIEKCAWCCEFYAENAENFLRPESVKMDAGHEAWVKFQPLGVVLAVMPWNFPFWQVIRFAAPSLMAGNVGLLKHASNVSMCSLALEKLFLDSGFANGVFQSLLVPSDKVAGLIASSHVQAVTLTGSTAAGRSVAENAGKNIKKVVLELGGSDPSIVLEDADLKLAARMCAKGRLQNSGQSCIAAKRFLVHEKVHAEFLEKLKAEFAAYKMGDPMDESVGIGTQASIKLRDELHDQVTRTIAGGAELIMGGKIPEGPAAFYPPSILNKVKPGHAAFDEEIFGPVATVTVFKNEEEAIRLANATIYGLGASVYSRDLQRAKSIADQIESGSVFINDFVKSDPRLPFGGIKESGLGRELSQYGIKEFVNIKTVFINS